MIGNNKTILITGINGFLGSNLAKSLSLEYNIIGLEYSLENLFRIKDYNFEIYSVKKQPLENIFNKWKIDIVIHTATVYRNNDESVYDMLQTNVLLPVKLYELSKKNNIKAFINTDTFFNDPKYNYNYLGEYTLSKRHCIEWLKVIQKKTKLVNMKIFHMYGPGDSPKKFVTQIIYALKQNKPEIQLTPGEQMRDFIYITDVLSAYKTVIKNIHLLDSFYTDIQVGTGRPITIKEFVETAAKVTKSNSKLLFGALNYRKGEIMFSKADISILKSFNWKPIKSLKSGIYEVSK